MSCRSLVVLAIAGLLVGAAALGLLALKTGPRSRPQPGADTLVAAVEDIEAGRMSTPRVSGAHGGSGFTVTFLAKRLGGEAPRIVSDITGWGEHVDGTFDSTAGTMARVGPTAWYSLQAPVSPGARVEYLIAYGPTDYRLDPHNPRQSAGQEFGGLRASEFVSPGYVPPRAFVDPPASPAGHISEATVESRALGWPARVVVYTPAGYSKDRGYPVAALLDLRAAQVSRVLDWLIARRAIEPIVAVFVGPASADYRFPEGEPVRAFVVGELLPWVASRFTVTRSADERAIIAISFGAKNALDVATSSPQVFGRLGLLIPGRRLTQGDLDAFAARTRRHLRVAILAGQYDRANLPTARGARQALCGAGHTVDYVEVPEGHSAVTWMHHLEKVLVSLFGTATSKGLVVTCGR